MRLNREQSVLAKHSNSFAMSANEISALVRKPEDATTEKYAIDFINARFRELEDLGQLDMVLKQMETQKNNLSEKVVYTKDKVLKTIQNCLDSFKMTGSQLEDLQSTRLELEDALSELKISLINSSDWENNVSNDKTLLEELINLQQRVESLEGAKKYLKVLVVADELSTQAKLLIEKSPGKALAPYTQLVHLSRTIQSQSKAYGESLHHLDIYLQKNVDALWEDMKSRLTKKFQTILDTIGWPIALKVPLSGVMGEKISTFKKAFLELLLLQQPTAEEGFSSESHQELAPLLPIQVMVEPLITRFRYHFDSKRPTNRIDKPEWYLTHLLTTIRDHSPFFTEEVQAIVDDAGFSMYNVKNDFIRCLLVAINRKLNHSLSALLNSPQIFSHTVYETLQFDQVLRDIHLYVPPGKKEWKGCVEVFTGRKELFKAWLKIEKDFAELRYNEIMHSEDAWEMEDEEISEDDFKPTRSAEKIMDLLELVTSRYKPLSMFHNRIRFLVDIQAEILDAYAKRIESAVKAFENLSYTIVRAVPNAATADGKSVTGIEGLKRLCRWLSSAGYVSRMIREWGEDPFFLALWHEVNVRAAMNTNSPPLLSPTDSQNSIDHSHETHPIHENLHEIIDYGTIFDDTADTFDNLCERIQVLIVKNVSKEFISGLKAYNKKNNWSRADIYTSDSKIPLNTQETLNQDPVAPGSFPSIKTFSVSKSEISNNTVIEISSELYTPLSQLTHILTFLANSLPSRIFIHIYKELSKELEEYLWERVLMKIQFSEMGGKQFEVDMVKGLFMIGRRWIKKPENYFRRLRDACILLTLPSSVQLPNESEIGNRIPSNVKKFPTSKTSQQKTISQVLSVLSDQESEPTTIPRLLEELNIFHLTPKEAHEIVTLRIDCWK
ncbi:hypothetical protein G9A89_013362 [Geosiphon pyriformis]|nr:hypothetical protein G9A89_013362 [Geosiphon pyriformis]